MTNLADLQHVASELKRAPHTATAECEIKQAFDDVPLVCILTDSRGVIMDANRVAVSFFRVGRRTLLHKPLLHFVARSDVRAFRERVSRLSELGVNSWTARLRPRGAVPCVMRLAIEPVPATSNVIWTALPA